MTTRSEFLARVRAGLDSPAPAAAVGAPPEVDDSLVRLTHPGANLADLFSTRAAAAGMVIHRCTPTSLSHTVQSLLATLSTQNIVLDHLESPFARPIADALSKSGAQVIDPRTARNLDPQFDASAGITGVLAAIAETGTLVLASDARRSRGTFIVPPVHIAIVSESQIIPDMLDLWPLIGPTPPTALTLISGPSKTADIEGILVTGVHGPGAVHVVLIAEQNSPSSMMQSS
jgi:L-lactate dehydrogenase complex protein LldG